MATWSYQVKYIYDNSAGSPFVTPVDITANVITIENMTDVGTGEINTAIIQLNARDGNFITETSSGNTPKINQFDRIYIKITDKNSATFEKIYEVDTIEQKKTINEGIRLVLYLMGMERGLQQVHFSKQYFYENAFNVAKDICNRYNGSKGSKQVEIDHHDQVDTGGTYYNGLPKWTANNIDFGVSETYCYNGVNDLVNELGSSISAGGAGDFFEFNFIDDFTLGSGKYNANKIYFHAFSSGANGNQPSIPLIVNPDNALPIYSTKGTLENETGTIVFAKGSKGYGTMPINSAQFRGYKEEFALVPVWQSGISYPYDSVNSVGSRVNYFNNIYECNEDTLTTWSAGQWDQIKLGDLAGNIIYSPYTSTLTKFTSSGAGNDGSDGYKLMKSSGTNPDDDTDHSGVTTNFAWHGCWDSNLVVRDEEHFRTWVDCKALNSGAVPSELLQDGGFYRGFRVLVADGSGGSGGSPDFSGKSNMIMQYDGSAWKQMFPYSYAAPSADIANAQCAVLNEGKNMYYNSVAGYWQDDYLTIDKSNDCFHPSANIFSEDGVGSSLKSTGASVSDYAYGRKSATAWEYHFPVYNSLTGWLFTAASYYAVGAWANFKFPYPTTSDDLPSGYTVGSLYTNPTLDTNNMHLTPSGETGFNADDSEELGILEALEFFIKFKYYYLYIVTLDETLLPFTGKFKFRCTCYDTSDNVVVQDFEVEHNENWEYVSLPISNFKIYRARATKRWGNIASNLILPDLEVLEVFEWKNLKMVSIQCQESYDDVGRFVAEEGQINDIIGVVFNPSVSFTGGMNQRTRLVIDNLHFSKQLTATSGKDTSRNITPIFMERPYTTNYRQLQQDALSQLEIEQFRYEGFEVETEGECPANLRFGDSFYLRDSNVVEASDNGANTIKLVAKKITYTINGTDGGRGGFVRKIQGVKRI